MKQCPHCNYYCNDEDMVCSNCGYIFEPDGFENFNANSNDNSYPQQHNPNTQETPNSGDTQQSGSNTSFQNNQPNNDFNTPNGNLGGQNVPPFNNYNNFNSAPQNNWQNSYNAGNMNYNTEPQNNGMSVASLVLGIIGLVTSCCYGFGIIPGIISLIFGIISKKRIKSSNGTQKGDGFALAGIILSCFAIVISVIMLIYIIWVIANPDKFNEFMREYLEIYGK
jgi:rubredoxin